MSIKTLLIPQLNQLPKKVQIPVHEAGDAIPRIIHQVGMRPAFQNKQLPPLLQTNVERVRAMNPDWEYRFYDDYDIASFIQKNYPPLVWEYYQRIDPRYGAARADLFRYLLLYKVGGIYLDVKSSMTRPLNSMLLAGDTYVLSQWPVDGGQFDHFGLLYDLRHVKGGEYQQWHVICAPGHPFLKAVLEQVLSNIDTYDPHLHQTGKRGVLRLTGPIPYTLAIERIRAHHPHRVVESHKNLGLIYNIYENTSGHVADFKGHYSLQTASIVRLGPFRRQLSRLYGTAQYVHDRLRRRQTDTRLSAG